MICASSYSVTRQLGFPRASSQVRVAWQQESIADLHCGVAHRRRAAVYDSQGKAGRLGEPVRGILSISGQRPGADRSSVPRVVVQMRLALLWVDEVSGFVSSRNAASLRRQTYCFNSAFICSSSPPVVSGTEVSAAQLSMCCPSSEHCRSAAQPSV